MWLETERAQAWVKQNPPVEHWMDRLSSPETRNVFGHAFEVFCIWSKKTPAELLEMRREDLKDPDDGFRTLELVQDFILHGEYPDRRLGREGMIVRVAEASRARREIYESSIRSFFTHNRLELPPNKSFKIRDNENIAKHPTFMDLETARRIIGALKEPYRTLATCSLYGGLGRKEVLSINRLWPQIVAQLQAEKDPVRLDFVKRKSNNRPYFTFLPARLLKPYLSKATPFQIITKHSVTKMRREINESDIEGAWAAARKRAGINDKQTFHMLRDLLVTSFYKIGADVLTAQFLTGHSVDTNNYLQITKSPDRPQAEWEKYRHYLDSGTTSETEERIQKLARELETSKEENAELRSEMQNLLDMTRREVERLQQLANVRMEQWKMRGEIKKLKEDREKTGRQAGRSVVGR